jgi:class 3 adenylate cyclase
VAPHAENSTFLFADLAGFTALTEAHGDEDAIGIAMDFATRVRALLAEYRAQEVKTIGDEPPGCLSRGRDDAPDRLAWAGRRATKRM